MNDFFELDFLDVEADKSGDAIPLRYSIGGETYIHVVDGGFQATGPAVVAHIQKWYGAQKAINHVVATHPDGDHLGGLRNVLESFNVQCLWMLRPWTYAGEIAHRFDSGLTVPALVGKLRDAYPNIVALEEIAMARGIPILEPFQGALIGAFVVMAPTKKRYLDLIVTSDKTPPSSESNKGLKALMKLLEGAASKAISYVASAWGHEMFPADDTSAENEMSVVQWARICGQRILLTSDVGRCGLAEAADFAPYLGISLPGVDRFQVPHHGSRRNVSTAVLDRWLGKILSVPKAKGQELFVAIVSSAKKDLDHPRKAVVRAMVHRGAAVVTTENDGITIQFNAPGRLGWGPAVTLDYPSTQEE